MATVSVTLESLTENLIDLKNDVYHIGTSDAPPPLYSFLLNNSMILSSGVTYDINSYYTTFQSVLDNFYESYLYNASGFYGLLNSNKSLLDGKQIGTQFATDLATLSAMIDYQLAYINYQNILTDIQSFLSENSQPTIDISALISSKSVKVSDIEKALFLTPVIINTTDLRSYYQSVINMIDNTSDLYAIKDDITSNLTNFYATTSGDLVLKYLYVRIKELSPLVRNYVNTKYIVYTYLDADSTPSSKVITHDEKVSILQQLVPNANLELLVNLGNQVYLSINDAGQNLPVTYNRTDYDNLDDTSDGFPSYSPNQVILVNSDNQQVGNAGVVLDNNFTSSENAKSTSRDLNDAGNSLNDTNTLIDNLTNELNNQHTLINSDHKADPTVLTNIANQVNQLTGSNTTAINNINGYNNILGSIINTQNQANAAVSVIHPDYSDQVNTSIGNLSNTLLDVGIVMDDVNTIVSSNNSKLGNLVLAVTALGLLLDAILYPNEFIKSLINLLLDPLEVLLLVINGLICALKALLCMIAGLVKGIANLISSITSGKLLNDAFNLIKSKFNGLLSSMTDLASGNLISQLESIVVSKAESVVNNVANDVQGILGIDKANIFKNVATAQVSSITLDAISGWLKSQFNSIVSDIISSVDHTIKNALNLFNLSTCKATNFNLLSFLKLPGLGFNFPKLSIPRIDSKVISC